MKETRIFDLLNRCKERFVKSDTFGVKRDGKWSTFSTNDYIENSNNVSYGLLALGFKKGDKIATITNNRPEWNFVDMGILLAGMIHVPIYPTISKEEHEYILNHSEVKVIFVSDKILYKRISSIAEKIDGIEQIYTFNEIDGAKNWLEIIEIGKQHSEKLKNELINIKNSINENELTTIIYTSGTTGSPKGVMLSHKNIMSNVISATKRNPLDSRHRVLSFLPLCHIYERMLNYHYQYLGISIYYAENMGTIIDDMKEINPDGFSTVPRLLEKVFDKIISKGKNLTGLKKIIFFWAINLGVKYKLNRENGWFYELKLKLMNKLVFSKWREALGGNIKMIISGGASLQLRLEKIFWAAGIPVQVGYGLTETSPVIAVNDYSYPNIKFGTVGPLVKDVKVKISNDGEILVKGPNVMLGYYKDPKTTSEVIDNDGWLHTGDIGIIEDNKFLKITDRKKEIFKTSSGKYIAPQIIENKLKESFFIENIMVVGENEKFASALISPNFSFLHDWCSLHKIRYRDNKELISIPKVIARYFQEVNKHNSKLGAHEQIKRFRLVCEEWSPQTGELSPTLKLKRRIIYDKYENILKEIYSHIKEHKKEGGIKWTGLGNEIVELAKKITTKTIQN
ncbi:MAG: long-chain fatty acid--CoA ligase [Bacteroidales bacterium]|nr:long-chain fatty acid--CoA ligase [Bacteroidales bacterium]